MEEPKPESKDYAIFECGLIIQPVKMARKVSFRDQVKPEPLADVHYIPKNVYKTSDSGCLSCIKCVLF